MQVTRTSKREDLAQGHDPCGHAPRGGRNFKVADLTGPTVMLAAVVNVTKATGLSCLLKTSVVSISMFSMSPGTGEETELPLEINIFI